MYRVLWWFLEQMCRTADRRICLIVNLTDESPDLEERSSGIAPGRNSWAEDASAA
jgi:hypothetical protein